MKAILLLIGASSAIRLGHQFISEAQTMEKTEITDEAVRLGKASNYVLNDQQDQLFGQGKTYHKMQDKLIANIEKNGMP